MKGINFRWQHYKRNRIMGLNRYRSAIAAGYSESTARAHVLRLEVRFLVEKGGNLEKLDELGLSEKTFINSLIDMCRATKIVPCTKLVRRFERGNIKVIDVPNGIIEVPDYRLQLQVIELIFRLKGYLGNNKQQPEEVNQTKVFIEVEKTT